MSGEIKKELQRMLIKGEVRGFSVDEKSSTVIIYVSNEVAESIDLLKTKYPKYSFVIKKIGEVRAL